VDLSVLDLFILRQLDSGLRTPYDLQTQTGMSLGASVPALERLKKKALVRREDERRGGKRLRHCYALTDEGAEHARRGWKPYLSAPSTPKDLESILRLVDIALHYRSKHAEVTHFLERAAAQRRAMAEEVGARNFRLPSLSPLSYRSARMVCEEVRLRAEADALANLAKASSAAARQRGIRGSRPVEPQPGQAMLIECVDSLDQKG